MKSLDKQVLSLLRQSGWKPSRDEHAIEREFERTLAGKWLPIAGPFLRRFGGLSINNKLWVWSKPAADHPLLKLEQRIAATLMSKVVAVASSSYVGDGCVIWIDEKGRFFAVDSEGILFVGCDEAVALQVLLLGVEPPQPPPDIEKNLKAGYEWGE